MKTLIGTLIVTLVAGLAAAQDYQPLPKPKLGPNGRTGLTQKEFDVVKAGLEKNAAVILEGLIEDRDVPRILSNLAYDKATWDMVKTYLNSLPRLTFKGKRVEDCHRLYLVCELTMPLLFSKPEVIREALPTVRELEKTYGNKYMKFPNWSPAILKSCKLPAQLPPGAQRTVIVDQVDKARQKKMTAEQPTILTNQYIGVLEQIYCCLMAFAEEPKEDARLVEFILTNLSDERKRNDVWTMGVQALNSEAGSGQMSKERASAIYQQLFRAGKALEWNYRWYLAYYMPDFSPDDVSTAYTLKWEFSGYLLLTSAKWLDMVVKDIKSPNDPKTLVVPNPNKQDEKFKADRDYWPPARTRQERNPVTHK